MFKKKDNDFFIALGGRCFKFCMLFWDGDNRVKHLIYAMTTGYFYRELGPINVLGFWIYGKKRSKKKRLVEVYKDTYEFYVREWVPRSEMIQNNVPGIFGDQKIMW